MQVLLRKISEIPGRPIQPDLDQQDQAPNQAENLWDGCLQTVDDGVIIMDDSSDDEIEGTQDTEQDSLSDNSGEDRASVSTSNATDRQGMAIDYIVGAPPMDLNAPLQTSSHDHPDSSAPEKNPRENIDKYLSNALKDLRRGKVFERFIWIFQAVGFVSVNELVELWEGFLTTVQRLAVIRQLKLIKSYDPREVILKALENTLLRSWIESWRDFKVLAFQAPLNISAHMNATPTRDTAWIVLCYCMVLENTRSRNLPAAFAAGLDIPNRLRIPAKGYDLRPPPHFAHIFDALTERALCRKKWSEGLRLPNYMVLEEVVKYAEDLKEVVDVVCEGWRGNGTGDGRGA